jgi:hypothetical protein
LGGRFFSENGQSKFVARLWKSGRVQQTAANPFRRNDLIHTDWALLERLEELLAHTKTSPANVVDFQGGYVVCNVSPIEVGRLWDIRNVVPRLWSDSMEIDSLGTTAHISRDPVGFVTLSTWLEADVASAKLRKDFLGAALWSKHQSELLLVVAQQLTKKFSLVSRPANSTELPLIAKLAWGYLAQLPAAELSVLCDYIYLPPVKEYDLPIVHELGGHLVTVLAMRPGDRIKLALCFNSLERNPIHEFQNWLFRNPEPAVT